MTPEAALDVFLSRGLLSARDIVEGNLAVEEVPGRNRNFLLTSSAGESYFLKVAAGEGADRADRLRAEAHLYEQVRDEASLEPLRQLVPALVFFDESQSQLGTRVAPGAIDFFSYDSEHTATGLPDIAESLGRALATCHSVTIDGRISGVLSRKSVPWILDLHRPTPDLLYDVWGAQLELIRTIQDRPGVCGALDRLRETWRAVCLVHGDLKFSNIVLIPAEASLDVMIVDWETASLGDPAWDVGSVMQGYLWHCVYDVAQEEESDPAAAASLFARRLQLHQREIRRFVEAYADAARLSIDARADVLQRAAKYCGARLLQTAYEHAVEAELPGRAATGLLQLSINILEAADPKAMLRDLLGIHFSER